MKPKMIRHGLLSRDFESETYGGDCITDEVIEACIASVIHQITLYASEEETSLPVSQLEREHSHLGVSIQDVVYRFSGLDERPPEFEDLDEPGSEEWDYFVTRIRIQISEESFVYIKYVVRPLYEKLKDVTSQMNNMSIK